MLRNSPVPTPIPHFLVGIASCNNSGSSGKKAEHMAFGNVDYPYVRIRRSVGQVPQFGGTATTRGDEVESPVMRES